MLAAFCGHCSTLNLLADLRACRCGAAMAGNPPEAHPVCSKCVKLMSDQARQDLGDLLVTYDFEQPATQTNIQKLHDIADAYRRSDPASPRGRSVHVWLANGA